VLEERVLSDVEAMEQVLEGALQAIEWPRETMVSAEVDDGGRLALLDVDLPEVEDMPKTTASVPSRGYKLTVKEMPATKIQKLYMQHVHSVGSRIIGEVFAVLPKAEEVLLSAFSQRANKATGKWRTNTSTQFASRAGSEPRSTSAGWTGWTRSRHWSVSSCAAT
jgi:hypothetical protein